MSCVLRSCRKCYWPNCPIFGRWTWGPVRLRVPDEMWRFWLWPWTRPRGKGR